MARFVIEMAKDAIGDEIKCGGLYGHTLGDTDMFRNEFVLVNRFVPSDGYHTVPFLECLCVHDGDFLHNIKMGREPYDIVERTIRDSGRLWPIPFDIWETNECCIRLRKYKKNS